MYFKLNEGFNADPATNRIVSFQPLNPFPGNLFYRTSSVSADFWISNMAVGDYVGTILRYGSAAEIGFQVSVLTNDSGILYATNRLTTRGTQTYPQSGKSTWTIAAADARYALKSEAGNPNAITNNDTRTILLPTLTITEDQLNGGEPNEVVIWDALGPEWQAPPWVNQAGGAGTNNSLRDAVLVGATSAESIDVSGAVNAASVVSESYADGGMTIVNGVVTSGSLSGNIAAATATTATTATTANAAIVATNSPAGEPLLGISGTNAYASFSHNNGTIHASSQGWHGNYLVALTNLQITAVAHYNQGNHTNRVIVGILDTNNNVLARGAGYLPTGTTGPRYIALDKPVIIPKGTAFKPAQFEYYQKGHFYAVSTPTLQTGASAHFTHSGAASPNTTVAEGYFSGWAGLGWDINFLYSVVSDDDAQNAFLAQVRAPKVVASMHDSFNGPAALDLSLMQDDRFKVPQMEMGDFVFNYDRNKIPDQSNIWWFAHSMATNGMFAAGWDTVRPDDFTFLAVASTNTSMVLTAMNQFHWAQGAGNATGGTNVVPILIPRDGNGLTYINTNTFPGGWSNLIYVVGTNRIGDKRMAVGWYWNQRTNINWFSNEVYRATREGFVSVFLDTSVNEPWFGTDQIETTTRQNIRTFQQATLAAAEPGLLGTYSNLTHGMLLNAAGVANRGINSNDPESQWVSGDFINGVNGYLWHGGDVSTMSNITVKADILMLRSRWYRPGHIAHWQFMKFDNTQSAEWFRSKCAVVLLVPASLAVGPDVFGVTGDKMWVLTNQYPWQTILKDPAVLPGRWAYTNDTNKRIGVRPLHSKTSGTNYIVLLNLADTNYNQFLNVTNFGGRSNVVYTLEAAWDYGTGTRTNLFFINETVRTIPPTNAMAYVVRPSNVTTNYISADQYILEGTSTARNTVSSPSSSSYAFAESWYQSSSANAAYSGFWIEPDVLGLIVNYRWQLQGSVTTNGWLDNWQTYYHTDANGRLGGVNNNVYVGLNNAIPTEINFQVPLPQTNAWKHLNFIVGTTSSNANVRIIPGGIQLIKIRP